MHIKAKKGPGRKGKKELYDLITKGKARKETSSKSFTGKKRTRQISLGWLHYDSKKMKYVAIRFVRGGGNRDVDLETPVLKMTS